MPDTVSVAEIVEIIDGPLQLTVCGTTEERCDQFSKCNIKDPLHRIRDRIIGTLMACTIAELASGHHEEAVAMPIATGGIAVAGRRPARTSGPGFSRANRETSWSRSPRAHRSKS